MAKKKTGRPPGTRNDVSCKIDRIIASKAKYVVSSRGISLAEYLSEALRPIVDRDHAAAWKETGGKP
jgi:hypothetical protein